MRIIYLILVATFLLTSCERIFIEPNQASTDPFTNFDYLWSQVDQKYSYFQLKGINWDEVRTEYRARLNNSMSEEELFDLLGDMLNELRDDHSNLVSPFDISRYNLALQSTKNYNSRTVEEFYIPKGKITGAFTHDFIADDEIGYIRYGSFLSAIDEPSLNHIINRYQGTKGLIIDVRENGGGSLDNVPKLLQRFTTQRRLAAYAITRNGPGRNDFGQRESLFVDTHDSIIYTNPVMILIDRGSYSATTFFALMSKSLPGLTLIGAPTGGGGGLPNGGQLPNGWTYRFSVTQLLDLNGNNFAEDGVPPDIEINFDWSDITKDEIIERAIEEINK